MRGEISVAQRTVLHDARLSRAFGLIDASYDVAIVVTLLHGNLRCDKSRGQEANVQERTCVCCLALEWRVRSTGSPGSGCLCAARPGGTGCELIDCVSGECPGGTGCELIVRVSLCGPTRPPTKMMPCLPAVPVGFAGVVVARGDTDVTAGVRIADCGHFSDACALLLHSVAPACAQTDAKSRTEATA